MRQSTVHIAFAGLYVGLVVIAAPLSVAQVLDSIGAVVSILLAIRSMINEALDRFNEIHANQASS